MKDRKLSSSNTSKIIIISIIAIVVIGLFGCCFFCGGMTALTSVVFPEESNTSTEKIKAEEQNIQAEVEDSTEKEEVKGIASQKYEYYRVLSVVDGDTLHLEINGKDEAVRLVGIDTPESNYPSKPVECFAKEAKNQLSELVLNKEVRIEYDSMQGQEDKYGRKLLYIWVEDLFVNEYMVAEGYAYAYQKIKSGYLEEFLESENEARSNEKGLWGDKCKCNKGTEVSRACISCNKSEVQYYKWDCTTYSEVITDPSCVYLCETKDIERSPPVQNWVCNCSKTCSGMSSCSEAYFQLNDCGCSIRDGDNDGVPCESICNY